LPDRHREAASVAARAEVRIVRAVAVRQSTGLQSPTAGVLQHQVTRRGGRLMIEFQ
jgi:hypothetical protein